MRYLLAILLLLAPVTLRAQNDTIIHGSLPVRKYLGPSITGASLIGMGSLLAFQPDMNNLAVTLRDEVMYHDLPKIHVDDYIQYLPALTPAVLTLCGIEGRHSFWKLAQLEGASYLLGAGWLNAGKYGFAQLRPDNSTRNSFPSGHTFFAFTGAEILRREYGKEYPWIAVAGYAVATLVGLMRIYNNRHWAGDVLAGAGVGILSVSLVYWTLD